MCDCKVLCPCWIGEDPDGGTCAGTISWHIDSGTVNGVDVSGRTITAIADIPGNVLGDNWKVLVVIDDGATDEQQQALLDVWAGQLGGPVADLSGLIGEVEGVVRAPVKFTVEEGQGVLRIGDLLEAEMSPYQGATGEKTPLNDTVFSTIPGSPGYVSKASFYRRATAEHGISPCALCSRPRGGGAPVDVDRPFGATDFAQPARNAPTGQAVGVGDGPERAGPKVTVRGDSKRGAVHRARPRAERLA